MRKILLPFLLMAMGIYGQELPEKNLQSSISEVTVFLEGAQISRTSKTQIPKGTTLLKLTSLSPFIDEKSVQVKAKGEFTILSVKHTLNYLDNRQKSQSTDSLQSEIEYLNLEIERKKGRLEVLKEKESLLDKNKNLNGENSSASLAQLKQAIEFYDNELTEIKNEYVKVQKSIKELEIRKNKIQSQMADVDLQKKLPSGQIIIRVEADASISGEFDISYMVGNAGWYPNYDLRVEDISSPIILEYKADVYQNTGTDWNNVKLKLSNGNPNQSGVAPELETWYLNYTRNTLFVPSVTNRFDNNVKTVSGKLLDSDGMPLPGVNVMVKGSTVGTQTDFDGNYQITLPNNAKYLVYSFVGYKTETKPISSSQINIVMQPDTAMLEEVVVTGYSGQLEGRTPGISLRGSSSLKPEARNITTSTIENQTTVEFEVTKPYSIQSTGEKLSVNLTKYHIDASYKYYAVPKLDTDAFLIARITNWDQYNLLEGETNLFFEDAYVGRTVLDAKSMNDTLNISLGRDNSIVIGREKVDQFSKRRTIGTNKIDTREFKIFVRNKKSQPIQLTIYDQIPVPAINDIDVDEIEISEGALDEKTGEITWDLDLKPNEQKEFNLKYEVKYPKSERVILE